VFLVHNHSKRHIVIYSVGGFVYKSTVMVDLDGTKTELAPTVRTFTMEGYKYIFDFENDRIESEIIVH
ncbi:MAG: hypothetical protein AAF603_08905, partial [Pseudomonadota bacterium]